MEDKIKELMSSIFDIDKESITEDSSIENIKEWDSLNHMKLITILEDEYNIEFDEDELLDMVSFKKIVLFISTKCNT